MARFDGPPATFDGYEQDELLEPILQAVVKDHEVRIAVIENMLTLTRRSSGLILPGK